MSPLGVVILATAILVAWWVTTTLFLPALDEIGTAARSDPAALPATISVCGRDWRKSGDVTRSHDEVLARDDREPVVVSIALFAPCPDDIQPSGADGDMATVVYVQTGPDAFVAYELVGGP